MKNRCREILPGHNKLVFKTYRINYPFGTKSKGRMILIKEKVINKRRFGNKHGD